jgi:hypothetical protein
VAEVSVGSGPDNEPSPCHRKLPPRTARAVGRLRAHRSRLACIESALDAPVAGGRRVGTRFRAAMVGYSPRSAARRGCNERRRPQRDGNRRPPHGATVAPLAAALLGAGVGRTSVQRGVGGRIHHGGVGSGVCCGIRGEALGAELTHATDAAWSTWKFFGAAAVGTVGGGFRDVRSVLRLGGLADRCVRGTADLANETGVAKPHGDAVGVGRARLVVARAFGGHIVMHVRRANHVEAAICARSATLVSRDRVAYPADETLSARSAHAPAPSAAV